MNRRPSGERLLRIGLISDTHCNEREDASASPYPANAEANPRARWAFAQLNEARPALVIHLGDMINPVPELPTYEAAALRFKEIASGLTAPLHLVPGNHDIGDKPVSWMPAGTVCDAFVDLYERHFGRHYYAFEHSGVLFIILNASLINSGLGKEAEQRAWLEQTFAANRGKRSFVFIHYPPYVSSPDEPGSYDNIDEPGRGWLLGLVETYRPEALFAGHVHNFWYDVVGDTETYVVPSTCFVRHDYSEMNRISAGDQYGRNDVDKLGFVLLDIYDQGHVASYVRSYGRGVEADRQPCEPGPAAEWPARIHTKISAFDNLGADMRHSWAEELDVAPSGAVDEFRRKRARNDYPVMALWELGLRRMRVPIQDLVDGRTRRRMALMHSAGHLFHVYCYGMPMEGEAVLLAKHASLVDRLEIVINWDTVDRQLAELARLGKEHGIPVIVSRVNRKDAGKHSQSRYNHLISHGFTPAEGEEVAAKLVEAGIPPTMSGIMFSVPRSECPVQAVRWASGFERASRIRPCLYVKSTSASPAEAFVDDAANAIRILHASMAAAACPNVEVILDTFADADRGYFVRTGLVDRRYNLRPAGRSLAMLVGLVNGRDWLLETDELLSPETPERHALVGAEGERIVLARGGRDACDGTAGLSLTWRSPGGSSKTVPLLSHSVEPRVQIAEIPAPRRAERSQTER